MVFRDRNTSQNLIREPGSARQGPLMAKPFRALSYLDAAQRLDGRTDIHTSIYVSTNQCVLMFLMGRFQVALKATDGLHYLGTIASDTLIRISAKASSLYQTLSGPYQTTLSTAKDLFTFATQREWIQAHSGKTAIQSDCMLAQGIDEQSEAVLLQTILNRLIAHNTQNTTEMGVFDARAKRLVDAIQVTYLFESIWK
ncbi:hypothetical protein BSLG_005685 [Batrachochytrium salamandrivorans]|nr:hypothetical protein BSLG_005685 [Batrachochytrium salamandrivorans]